MAIAIERPQVTVRRVRRSRFRRGLGHLLTYVGLLIALVFFLGPFFWIVTTSLKGNEINEAKKVLATEATALVHGRAAADQAAKTALTTFEQGGMGDNLPTIEVKIGDGILAASTKIGFSSSNSQARQFIKDGAIYLGDEKITDPNYRLRAEDFDQDGRAPLRIGTKKRGILTRASE